MTVLLLSMALATELALIEPTEARRYKVETFGFAPTPGDPYDLDWRQSMLDSWGALLVCTRESKRVDRCTFEGGVMEYAFVLEGDQAMQRFDLPAPEYLELVYTKTGKVKVSAKGDSEPFYDAIATASLARNKHEDRRAYSREERRLIGQSYEQAFQFWIAGALELQFPKGGDAANPWITDAPLIAQTWVGGAYGGKIDWRIEAMDGDVAVLMGEGRFGETDPNPSIGAMDLKGTAQQLAAYDTRTGALLQTKVDVQFERQFPGNFTKRAGFMRVAQEGDTHKVGQIPGTPIKQ